MQHNMCISKIMIKKKVPNQKVFIINQCSRETNTVLSKNCKSCIQKWIMEYTHQLHYSFCTLQLTTSGICTMNKTNKELYYVWLVLANLRSLGVIEVTTFLSWQVEAEW